MFDTTVRARLLMAGLYHLGSHDANVIAAVRDLKASDFVADFVNADRDEDSLLEAVLISWAKTGDVQADLGEIVRLARHRDGSTAAIVASSAAMDVLKLALELDGPAFRPLLRSLGYDPERVAFENLPAAAVDRLAMVADLATVDKIAEVVSIDQGRPRDRGVVDVVHRPDLYLWSRCFSMLEHRGWTKKTDGITEGDEWVEPGTGEVFSWAAALEIEHDNDMFEISAIEQQIAELNAGSTPAVQ